MTPLYPLYGVLYGVPERPYFPKELRLWILYREAFRGLSLGFNVQYVRWQAVYTDVFIF